MGFEKGMASYWKGKSRSEETKRKISETKTGVSLTDRHRENISKGLTGIPSKRKGKNFPQIAGKNHYLWKGGRKKNRKYFMVLLPSHPFANKGGYVYEHRVVFENKIKRFLNPKEVVHHIDNNPSNNSPDNLILCKNNSKHRNLHRKTI